MEISSEFPQAPGLRWASRRASPNAAKLDDHLCGFVHVLRRHPFEPGMEVVLAGEQVRRGQPHERKARAVRASTNRPFDRLDAHPTHGFTRAFDDFGMLCEHLTHIAVLL